MLFVRDRLLRDEETRADLLSLYARVRNPRQKVPDDETNPLVGRLRLTGVVRGRDGYLRVRNRIYERVFDPGWITANLPDVELRRLRALAREEARKRRLAEERERAARRNLYAAEINLAYQALTSANGPRAVELLIGHRPEPGQEELRGFEWAHLWHLAHHDDSEQTLHGHQWVVSTVAFSPDGRSLASSSWDGSVRFWDLGTGRERVNLEGRWLVALSPDGRLLACRNEGAKVVLWDVATRRRIAALDQYRGNIRAFAFSPDSRFLASSSWDGTVRLWEVEGQSVVATLEGHEKWAGSPAFSPNGKLLATCGGDATVRLWDLGSRVELERLDGYGETGALAFSPDGRTLALGDAFGGSVKLWDVAHGKLASVFPAHEGADISLAFSPDSRLLATGGADGKLKLWNLEARQEVATYTGHRRAITSVAFSPDGRIVASGSWDHTIKLWPVPPRRYDALRGRQSMISRLAISANGERLAAGGEDGSIAVWDLTTSREMALLQGHESRVEDLVLSPDGARLFSVSPDKTARVWDVASGREVAILERKTRSANHVIALSPDGRLLAWGGDDHQIPFWDVATHQDAGRLEGHTGHIAALAFSPDGKLLASGSGPPDATVRLWDLGARRQVATLFRCSNWVAPVAFSPDGKRLAAGVGMPEYTIKVWDVGTRRELATLRRHSGQIAWIGFSPDGRTLVSLSADDWTIKLWSLSAWTEVLSFRDPRLALGAAFVPNGSALVTGRMDGELHFWRATTLVEAETRLTLARHEWKAEEAGRRRHWSEALVHLDRLVEAEPEQALLRVRRGQAHAELGHWTEAGVDLAAAFTLQPAALASGADLALVQLAIDDTAGYRETCRELLRRWREGINQCPWDVDRATRVCTLAPGAAVDLSDLVRWAEETVARDPERPGLLCGLLCTLGAALFRTRRCSEAVARLNEAIALHPHGGAVENWHYLALSHQELGHAEEARQSLETASRKMDEMTGPRADGSALPPIEWQERLQFQILRREAEAILRGDDG